MGHNHFFLEMAARSRSDDRSRICCYVHELRKVLNKINTAFLIHGAKRRTQGLNKRSILYMRTAIVTMNNTYHEKGTEKKGGLVFKALLSATLVAKSAKLLTLPAILDLKNGTSSFKSLPVGKNTWKFCTSEFTVQRPKTNFFRNMTPSFVQQNRQGTVC